MTDKELENMAREAAEAIGRDMKTNKFVSGEMQFTDLTNASYFIKTYGNIIRYCITWNKFLFWNDTCWEIDNRGRVEELIPIFVHQVYRSLRFIQDRFQQESFEKHLIKSESFRRLQAIAGILKMSKEIKVEDWELDSDNYLFNVENLTLNLRTGKAREPNTKHLITKKSNFIYDKAADCPVWKMFLMQIF